VCEEHESKESIHGTNTGEELSTLAVVGGIVWISTGMYAVRVRLCV